MTIAAEPAILNFFLPWIKQEDDDKMGERQDKFVKSKDDGEQEMIAVALNIETTDNAPSSTNAMT
jgi:hypothetical protein